MKKKTQNWALTVTAGIAALILITGCGGSGSGTASDPTSGSGPSSDFLQPGSPTNELVKFGSEAPTVERAAASAVLAKNLEARENADFAAQCSTLSKVVLTNVARPKKGPALKVTAAEKACPAALGKLAKPLSATKPYRVDTFDGQIAALRVKGTRASALYHGTDGKDYQMPMVKEGPRWTVASLLTTELNPPKAPNEPSATKPSKPTN